MVLSVVARARGNTVWTSSVKEANFFAEIAVIDGRNASELQTRQVGSTQPQLASGMYDTGRTVEYSSRKTSTMPVHPSGVGSV